jgi:uncharacterized protein
LTAPRQLSLAEARRLVLSAQGFARPRPEQVEAAHVSDVITALALLQLDFVTVVVPSHFLVLFSRLGPYERELLAEVVYRRRGFTEAWAHEASIVPMDAWPLLAHRRAVHRVRPRAFGSVIEKQKEYVRRVLREVKARGPLTADDLPAPLGLARRIKHSWYGTVPRVVLEAHFGRGLLAVAERRPNFARAFDLPERIVPDEHRSRRLPPAAAQRELLLRAARALGVAQTADLADYWRLPVAAAVPRVAELARAGALAPVHVEGWRSPAWTLPDAAVPDAITARALLSPFDPLIWFRARTRRLFHFDFRMEVFVPAPLRRWGIYVLPFLMGERLVARVDLKTDRTHRLLRVLGAFLEADARADEVAPALAAELHTLAAWLGLRGLAMGRRGNFARALGAALRAHAGR